VLRRVKARIQNYDHATYGRPSEARQKHARLEKLFTVDVIQFLELYHRWLHQAAGSSPKTDTDLWDCRMLSISSSREQLEHNDDAVCDVFSRRMLGLLSGPTAEAVDA
jgi:hypothetical protein